MKIQKISPCLWFTNNGEEAARFYTSIFKNSKVGIITHYPEGGPMPAGTVMTVSFEIDGQQFMALNGGADIKFTWAISLTVNCEDQQEIDYFWEKLLADGGKVEQCGWLKDKFGLSWQVVPTRLMEMHQDADPKRRTRVMQAMMKMIKLDIAALEAAYKD